MKYNFDEVINRKGTYCTQWDYIEDRFSKKDLLPFSISDTDFKIPCPITDKLKEVMNHEIYGYTRWNHHDFKGAIADYYERRFNCFIDEDWILYSPSVMYSVSVLIRLLSNPKDKILAFNPMYDAFFSVIEENDRQLVSETLKEEQGVFKIDFESFDKKIKECKIMLLCSPHNPTGRVWTNEEIEHIIKSCKRYGVKIISDEIHMDIILGKNKHIPILKYIKEYTQLYLVSSASKTLNTPGLIGSYSIIPSEEIREKFLLQTRKKDFLNSVSIFGMYATMVGYRECDDYIDQLVEYIKENTVIVEEFIKKELPQLKYKPAEGTYLAWIDVRELPFTKEEIQCALVDEGKVGIMPGETYGDNGAKYLRLNCGCPKEKLIEGLWRLKKGIEYLYR
ncbi:MalY/PatB family protein [Clostridium intestinale]|uniref:cysteine-S-conjugate beta-lyase n=1 Tax=Clostridium intestinale DSM 6191 TaxID=1121320 RepID=A0A1M5WC92_9CLOT|nr:PatB family C-S lyase [Clostridium intestinale]SHH85125.1 cystathione beta-lyase [Clostridium intestinale DSM 6191]